MESAGNDSSPFGVTGVGTIWRLVKQPSQRYDQAIRGLHGCLHYNISVQYSRGIHKVGRTGITPYTMV